MSLPPLAIARPAAVANATELLTADDAQALAGGQSLVPALAARGAGPRPRLLVDLGGLPGLDAIELGADGWLSIGALVRQRTAERSPLVARHAPLLPRALALVGHPATRNRGTVVGSLANADPAAEVPAVAVALDATVTIAGPGGVGREAPVAELLAGPGRITLAGGELVTALRIPPQPPGERQAWVEFAPRRFDLPLVGVAVRLAEDGAARATLAGVGPTPLDVRLGRVDGEPALDLDPPGDRRAPAELRRHLARTLIVRALAEAADG